MKCKLFEVFVQFVMKNTKSTFDFEFQQYPFYAKSECKSLPYAFWLTNIPAIAIFIEKGESNLKEAVVFLGSIFIEMLNGFLFPLLYL